LFSEHLHRYLKQNGISLSRLFNKVSKNETINRSEFRLLAQDISNYALDANTADQIFLEIDKTKDDMLEFEELEFLYDEKNAHLNIAQYTKFKMLIIEESSKLNTSIFEVFTLYDVQKTGSLGRADLGRLITKYLPTINGDDQRAIFNEMDSDSTEKILYEDFRLAVLGPYIDTDSLLLSMKRIIRGGKIELAAVMAQMDTGNTGGARFAEFSTLIDRLDMNLSHIEKEYLFDEIGMGKNRRIEYADLLSVFDPKNFKEKKSLYSILREFKLVLGNSGESWKPIYKKYEKGAVGGILKVTFGYFANEIGYKISRFNA
jgi:Ca2+-binding EF-hand superfamily protein